MDLYEREFGICHHGDANSNPLSSVLYHDEEDVWKDSALRDLIEDFASYDMGSLWNMSFIEFLSLPMPYTQIMKEVRDRVIARKGNELDKLKLK